MKKRKKERPGDIIIIIIMIDKIKLLLLLLLNHHSVPRCLDARTMSHTPIHHQKLPKKSRHEFYRERCRHLKRKHHRARDDPPHDRMKRINKERERERKRFMRRKGS